MNRINEALYKDPSILDNDKKFYYILRKKLKDVKRINRIYLGYKAGMFTLFLDGKFTEFEEINITNILTNEFGVRNKISQLIIKDWISLIDTSLINKYIEYNNTLNNRKKMNKISKLVVDIDIKDEDEEQNELVKLFKENIKQIRIIGICILVMVLSINITKIYTYNVNKNVKYKLIRVGNTSNFVDSNGIVASSSFINYHNELYYADEYGNVVKERLVKDKDAMYYIDNKGVVKKNSWSFTNEGWVYSGIDGKLIKGQWIFVDNSYYYLQDNYILATNQWLRFNNKKCYVNENGEIVKDKIINNKKVDSLGYLVN